MLIIPDHNDSGAGAQLVTSLLFLPFCIEAISLAYCAPPVSGPFKNQRPDVAVRPPEVDFMNGNTNEVVQSDGWS